MTQVEWLRKRRDRLNVMQNELAHNVASGLPHDDYLIKVGRYKQLKALVAWFDQEIEKVHGGDDSQRGSVDEDGIGVTEMDDDADFQAPVPTRKPAARQTARRPREWGG